MCVNTVLQCNECMMKEGEGETQCQHLPIHSKSTKETTMKQYSSRLHAGIQNVMGSNVSIITNVQI